MTCITQGQQNKGRIYTVTNSTAKTTQMVKAHTPAQALRHVARHVYSVTVASAIDVADHMADGWKIEDATAEPEPAATA